MWQKFLCEKNILWIKLVHKEAIKILRSKAILIDSESCFSGQLAILRSGISLLRGLELYSKDVLTGKWLLLCHRLQAHLYSGSSLTATMQGKKHFFSPFSDKFDGKLVRRVAN